MMIRLGVIHNLKVKFFCIGRYKIIHCQLASGSVKRVAAAVGKGVQVVAAFHAFLAETGGKPTLSPALGDSDVRRMPHANGILDVTPSALYEETVAVALF